ncbi:MAG: transporter [Planctomycetes bacterium]|jgi:hypothetical protein|nr:transporter [Planctomycetota bacterium]
MKRLSIGLIVVLALTAGSTAAMAAPGVLTAVIADLEQSPAVMADEALEGILIAGATPAEGSAPAAAPAGGDSADELANKLANPISDLISIPFQLNYDEGYGSRDVGWWTLKVQPVIPVGISEDWNLITRVIAPFVWRQAPVHEAHYESGLGDINPSFFFSPKAPMAGFIWGVGPTFLLPTATNADLGTRKWSAGPTAVVLRQEGPLTVGFLTNHLWSFAGNGDRDSVNVTFMQPFVSYGAWKGGTISLNAESTYDWHNSDWTIPLNLMLGQILPIANVPVQFQIGVRYYAKSPDGGPEWGLRFGITILLPK